MMLSIARIAVCLLVLGALPAQAWELPPDGGTMPKDAVASILSGTDAPESNGYKQSIDVIDFSANGQNFSQVVITLTPDKPRLHGGKKLVVVGGEPGSEYGMDFVLTVEGKEGLGVWLAKRGITFVALTRIGRWNFLAPAHDGSWADIPIDQRMPIFNRQQKAPWSANDYTVTMAGKTRYRFAKSGTALEKEMLAATPNVFLEGYRRALVKAIPDRPNAFVLFWGMSTGGASLYPLAKSFIPDGYLGWGTSTTGLAAIAGGTQSGDYGDLYEKSALRVRERGPDDFATYTTDVDAATRGIWWQAALKSPRFKSVEDASMNFNVAALTEQALRLWHSDVLPADLRRRGLAALIQDVLEPSYPPAELKRVAVLDLNGTRDEALPPAAVDRNRTFMQSYTRKYRVGRIEGLHHYLFTQASIKVVGTIWLRYIDSGYSD